MNVDHLTCVACHANYRPGTIHDVCPNHPGLEGILSVANDMQPGQLRTRSRPLPGSTTGCDHEALVGEPLPAG